MKKANSIIACCVVTSSVDVTAVDDDTFRVLVNQYSETFKLDYHRARERESGAIVCSQDAAYLESSKHIYRA